MTKAEYDTYDWEGELDWELTSYDEELNSIKKIVAKKIKDESGIDEAVEYVVTCLTTMGLLRYNEYEDSVFSYYDERIINEIAEEYNSLEGNDNV